MDDGDQRERGGGRRKPVCDKSRPGMVTIVKEEKKKTMEETRKK